MTTITTIITVMAITTHQRKGFGERGLNLSVSGAVAQDLPEMAKQLVNMVCILMIMLVVMMNMVVVIMIMVVVMMMSTGTQIMMPRVIKSLQISSGNDNL